MTNSATQRILEEYHRGANTRRELAAATGVDSDFVDLIVDTLIHEKQLDTQVLKAGCGAGGCRSCVEGTSCSPRSEFSAPDTVNLGMPKFP